MIHPDRKPADCSSESLLRSELKWGIRQDGSGTLHFLNELLAQHSMKINDLSSTVKVFFQSRNRGTHSYRTVRRSYRNT
jgi:hypothetical protein